MNQKYNTFLWPVLLALAMFSTVIGKTLDTQVGYYGMCAIAWISFFAFTLTKDYSGGMFINLASQVFMLSFTVVVCAGGEMGDLGRAILLGILPAYGCIAMWEFYKRAKSGNIPSLFRM